MTYTDGTTSTTSYKLYDWYDSASVENVYKDPQFMRAQSGRTTTDGSTIGGPYIQSATIDANPEKLLKSITFEMTGKDGNNNCSGLYCGIYAVSGMIPANTPAKPSPTATNISCNSFKASWAAVDNATSYRLDVATDSGFKNILTNYNNREISTTSINIIGLEKNTPYYFRVRSVNSNGQSGSSDVVTATTLNHTHLWGYASPVNGTSITATCSADNCTLTSETKSVTISLTAKPQDLTNTSIPTWYKDEAIGFTITGADEWEAAMGSLPTIYYEGRSGTSYTKSATVPTEAGKYKAYITVEGSTITKNFQVLPLVSLSDDNIPKKVSGSNGEVIVTVRGGSDNPLINEPVTAPTGGKFVYQIDGGEWNEGSIPLASNVTTQGTSVEGVGNQKQHNITYKFVGKRTSDNKQDETWNQEVVVAEGGTSYLVTMTTETDVEDIDKEYFDNFSSDLKELALSKMEYGHDINLILSVKIVKAPSNADVQKAIKKIIDEMFDGVAEEKINTIYLDVQIDKYIDNVASGQLPVLEKPIEIEANLQAGVLSNAFTLMRNHDGNITVFKRVKTRPTSEYVDGTYYVDELNNKLYIYSKYYSDYALTYAKDCHNVVFDSKGGSDVREKILPNGKTTATFATPEKADYAFAGWYKDETLSTPFDEEEVINSYTTLYANWKQHEHDSFSYTADGSTLIAQCTNTVLPDTCELPNRKIVLPMTASSPIYSGEVNRVTLGDSNHSLTAFCATTGLSITEADVVYYKKDGKKTTTQDGASAEGKAPANAGSYVAKLSVGEATAIVEFEIKQQEVSLTETTVPEEVSKPTGEVYSTVKTGTNTPLIKAPENVPAGGKFVYKIDDGEWNEGTIPVASDITETGTSIGNGMSQHTITYKFKGDENHEDIEDPAWTQTVIVADGETTHIVKLSNEPTATNDVNEVKSDSMAELARSQMVPEKNVNLELNVKIVKEPTEATSKTLIQNTMKQTFDGVAENLLKTNYLDIEINKTIDNVASGKMRVLEKPIEIKVSLNSGVLSKAFLLVRNHDGQITVFKRLATKPEKNFVDGTFYVDETTNTLYLYSKLFSDYALTYAENCHSVLFDTQGGTEVSEKILPNGKTTITLPKTTKGRYTFAGWYMESDCKTLFDKNKNIQTNITLFAKWTHEHDWDAGKIIKEATVNNKGEKLFTCRICNETKTESIAKLEQPGNTAEQTKKNKLDVDSKFAVITGKNITVKWGNVSGADGYDIYMAYCGKGNVYKLVGTAPATKNKIVIKKLNGKAINQMKHVKCYVLAYKLVDGKKKTLAKTITAHAVGKKNKLATDTKKINIKKTSYILSKGKSVTIKATTVKKNKKLPILTHTSEFRYATSDSSIATVSKKGKITAKGKGTCVVYVYSVNGYARKIKVTVK